MLLKSPMTKALAAFAICVSSTPALANPACIGGAQGCVLPVPDAAPPVVQTVDTTPIVDEGGGLGILPILAGLAALGVLAWLLLDDDEEEEPVSP